MLEKHLKRIKKAESGLTEEDEWEEIPTLGQKLEDQIIAEVPDRSVIIERINKKNLDAYEEDAPKVKDAFSNTAQYTNLVRQYVEEKKSGFDKFKKDYERFEKEIARGGDLNESRRIFRTVNVLVDLVNEKNKVTLNELNSVKAELRELQKKYVEVMSKLK